MKFDVLNRWSGAIQFTAEIEADENTPLRVKIGLALKWAVESRADLSDAVLRDAVLRRAVLRRAVLSGADLSGADLSGAVLRRAVLSGAVLSGADLSGAVLSGADLSGADEIPAVENLDSKILAAIENGGSLDMGAWHTCETTHCRAGWAVHLAGEAGKVLEEKFGPATAGTLIYAKSYPDMPIPSFYTSNALALEDIKRRAEADKAPA